MKQRLLQFAAVAITPAVAFIVTSCSSTPEPEHASSASYVSFEHGVAGGVAVDTYKVAATVAGLDRDKREVTLETADGKKTTVKAGPEVENFNQIRIGDQVTATVTEQLVVYLRKVGVPSASQTSTVILAPKGDKPGVVAANTIEVIATVSDLDLNLRRATLLFPNGETKVVRVRADVDLKTVRTGDQVVIRATEAVALLVEKP